METLLAVGKIVGRTDDGKVLLEVGQDVDVFHLEDGDEFVTLSLVPDAWLAVFGEPGS